eukprot:TRINITY_DN8682_c0_g1_i3.p1 TRINITY_DN8682_c0_g1~~TRINITY_DN8682_c0_g1_i3.p1  ORF type:complete len:278 (-),score=30.20 TRINITY_DN8682_c0_g1_i3:16-849(-)
MLKFGPWLEQKCPMQISSSLPTSTNPSTPSLQNEKYILVIDKQGYFKPLYTTFPPDEFGKSTVPAYNFEAPPGCSPFIPQDVYKKRSLEKKNQTTQHTQPQLKRQKIVGQPQQDSLSNHVEQTTITVRYHDTVPSHFVASNQQAFQHYTSPSQLPRMGYGQYPSSFLAQHYSPPLGSSSQEHSPPHTMTPPVVLSSGSLKQSCVSTGTNTPAESGGFVQLHSSFPSGLNMCMAHLSPAPSLPGSPLNLSFAQVETKVLDTMVDCNVFEYISNAVLDD